MTSTDFVADTGFCGPVVKKDGHEWSKRSSILKIAVPQGKVLDDYVATVSSTSSDWHINTVAIFSDKTYQTFHGIYGEAFHADNQITTELQIEDICCCSHPKTDVKYNIVINSDGETVEARLDANCLYENREQSCGKVPDSVLSIFQSERAQDLFSADVDHFTLIYLIKVVQMYARSASRAAKSPSPSPIPSRIRNELQPTLRRASPLRHVRAASDTLPVVIPSAKGHKRGASTGDATGNSLAPIGTPPSRGRSSTDSKSPRYVQSIKMLDNLRNRTCDLVTNFYDFYNSLVNDQVAQDEIRRIGLYDGRPLTFDDVARITQVLMFWNEQSDFELVKWHQNGGTDHVDISIEALAPKFEAWLNKAK